MKHFMNKNYLLPSKTGRILFHKYAKNVPIFDFHCHLDAKDIYEDREYGTLTELWLGGDHYKWRLLREAGVDESLVTGNAPDREKFRAYAAVCARAVGNPIYAWTHLELQRYFGIKEPLTPENADEIYDRAGALLPNLTARKLIVQSRVSALCTTDDPTSDLRYHIALAKDASFPTKVLPTFRPDGAIKITAPTFLSWIEKLASVVGFPIQTYAGLLRALSCRVDFFDSVGCVVSDHSLEPVPAPSDIDAATVFAKALAGEKLTAEEADAYRFTLLCDLSAMYAAHGWAQQYHIGALRNNSALRFEKLGPDTGFDAIGDGPIAASLSALLSREEAEGHLPKTVLYCLNPSDNATVAALMNCFQGGVPGKIQYGSAWWFNDQKDGMERQLETLMQLGLLSEFVGMLTDSRSFLSYARHEYFRRILCNKLGALVDAGEYPRDIPVLGAIVDAVCYGNATRYFSK